MSAQHMHHGSPSLIEATRHKPLRTPSHTPGMPILMMAVFYSIQDFKAFAPHVKPGSWANWLMRMALVTGSLDEWNTSGIARKV